MGRKSKRKHHPDPEDVAKADRKEINSLCGQLLEGMHILLQLFQKELSWCYMWQNAFGQQKCSKKYVFILSSGIARIFHGGQATGKWGNIEKMFLFGPPEMRG